MFQTLTVALLLGSPFDDASHNGMLTTLPILFLLCCFFARFVFLDQRSLRHSIDLGISTLAQAWGLERGGRWACTATHLSYRRRPPASLLWGEACLNLGIGWVSFEEPNLSLFTLHILRKHDNGTYCHFYMPAEETQTRSDAKTVTD